MGGKVLLQSHPAAEFDNMESFDNLLAALKERWQDFFSYNK